MTQSDPTPHEGFGETMDGPNTHKMDAPSDVTSWTVIPTTRNVVADDGRGMTLRDEWWHVPSFVVEEIERTLAALPTTPTPSLDAAYRERNAVIAALFRTHGWPVYRNDAPDAPGWFIVYAETPAGQVSWHVGPDDIDLFDPPVAAAVWDGHSTDEKYRRLAALAYTEPKRTGDPLRGPSEADTVSRPDLRARLRAALDENGATSTANQGLHSWRCEYPNSYGQGPCDCVDILLDDLCRAALEGPPHDPE